MEAEKISCYLLLGRTLDLAVCELKSLFPSVEVSILDHGICEVVGEFDLDVLMQRSGGVIKAFQLIGKGEVSSIVAKDIEENNHHEVALSTNTNLRLQSLVSEIKRNLNKTKTHFRILLNNTESSGILSRYQEYCLSGDMVLKTIAVQDLSGWTERDYGRPQTNPHAGMLPPKIARMMVNIALPEDLSDQEMLLDPFCGSGTILIEALNLGVSVIGADISNKQVFQAEDNCRWYSGKHHVPGSFMLVQSDVMVLGEKIKNKRMDAIVFEGYLGKVNPNQGEIKSIKKGLEKLYIGAFKRLNLLLKPGKLIVCALPMWEIDGLEENLDKVIDGVGSLGYTRLGRFTYGRDQARVKRLIYVLQKNSD